MSERVDCAKVSITRDNHHKVWIEIDDGLSGCVVLRVKMELEDYAKMITGLSYMPAKWEVTPNDKVLAKIRKRKEIKRVYCSFTKAGYDEYREKQGAEVQRHFDESGLADDGWEIDSYGLTTQQHGEEHEYMIARYVGVKDA